MVSPMTGVRRPAISHGGIKDEEVVMFEYTGTMTSFSVDDVDKAVEFYRNQLGIETERLESDREDGGVLILHPAGSNDILVYPKPDHIPATYTILNFVVADIDKAVDNLGEAGVRFLRFDDLGTDDKGIMRGPDREIAWFTDPAGNIHSVVEFKAPESSVGDG